mmetsp:Transcript_17545/g.57040  ORF Transcript_17545/g.57040 Transcript_17545/m.57040 type:complete len:159 (+) Transcript_17545:48-524(+)
MASGGVLMKVGGLVVKTLAKPVAKQLKADAQHIAWLRTMCTSLGWSSHYFTRRLSHATSLESFRKPYKHVDLKDSDCLNRGSEIVSEGLVLGVAIAVAAYEYEKSAHKKVVAEQKQEAREAQAAADLEARLVRIEAGLADVSAALRDRPKATSWWRGS